LHDGLPFDYFTRLLSSLKAAAPGISLKAFSAVEIFFFHRLYGMSIEEILRRLQLAGLDSLPGGGAEVLSSRVRKAICPNKCGADEWLEVHSTAHRLGMKSNCTMLFGTVETLAERVDHLLLLRAQQAETAGFMAFIPLPFHPENNALGDRPAPTAAEACAPSRFRACSCTTCPTSRPIGSVLAWPPRRPRCGSAPTISTAPVSEEKIYHQAGSLSPQALTSGEIARLVRAAGRVPVERDTLYGSVAQAGGEAS
jgi:aminodeoxyfutalosine synthase